MNAGSGAELLEFMAFKMSLKLSGMEHTIPVACVLSDRALHYTL